MELNRVNGSFYSVNKCFFLTNTELTIKVEVIGTVIFGSINDGQPLDAKLRIMALLSELEKEMEEKFDRVCIQEPDFLRVHF